MSTRIKISALALSFAALLSYAAFSIGRSSTEPERYMANMVALQMQTECIKKNDLSCVSKANELMSSLTAHALKEAYLFGLDSRSKTEIAEFIAQSEHRHGGKL